MAKKSIKSRVYGIFLFLVVGGFALVLGRMVFALYMFGDFVLQRFAYNIPESAYVPLAQHFVRSRFVIALVITAVLLYVLVYFANRQYKKFKHLSKASSLALTFVFFFALSAYLLATNLFFYSVPFAEIGLIWFIEYNVFVALFCTAITLLTKQK